ncbi:MAG: hypothetical protein KL863_00130 [Rhizobium sp.]|nr:hypothetical protein [Rhizobium sp.]
MSNIANQLVAVVATLLGFVTHDLLTERQATSIAADIALDPVVTRSIDLDGLSLSWTMESLRAERVAQESPVQHVSASTSATGSDLRHVTPAFADSHLNHARIAAPEGRADRFLR